MFSGLDPSSDMDSVASINGDFMADGRLIPARKTYTSGQKRPLSEEIPISGGTKRSRTAILGSKEIEHIGIFCNFLNETQKKRLNQADIEISAQDAFSNQPGLDINTTTLSGSDRSFIDASVGSSGFYPPKSVFASIKIDDRSDAVEYAYDEYIKKFEKQTKQYLTEEGIIDSDEDLKITSSNLIFKDKVRYATIGCGAQHLLENIFRAIFTNPDDTIIIPTPSYGLLFKSIKNAGGNYALFPLRKEDGFRPNPELLESFILEKNIELRASYLLRLNFRLNKLRNELSINKELEDLCVKFSSILHQLSNTYDFLDDEIDQHNLNIKEMIFESDAYFPSLYLPQLSNAKNKALIKNELLKDFTIPLMPRVKAYLHLNPHNPTGHVLNQTEINLLAEKLSSIPNFTIIDDLAHKDILLASKKPGYFSMSKMKDKTISVFSFSKSFALANLRAGFAIGPKQLMDTVTDFIFESMVLPPITVAQAIIAVTSMPVEKRLKYLNSCNETYISRFQLIKSCIEGIDSIETDEIKQNIMNIIDDLRPNLDINMVLSGIKGVYLLTEPEGCFFALIDFSRYQKHYLGTTQLTDGISFADLLYHLADIKTIPSELNGRIEIPSLRFSLSISEAEIIDAMLRIRKVISLLTPESNPNFEYSKDTSNPIPSSLSTQGFFRSVVDTPTNFRSVSHRF